MIDRTSSVVHGLKSCTKSGFTFARRASEVRIQRERRGADYLPMASIMSEWSPRFCTQRSSMNPMHIGFIGASSLKMAHSFSRAAMEPHGSSSPGCGLAWRSIGMAMDARAPPLASAAASFPPLAPAMGAPKIGAVTPATLVNAVDTLPVAIVSPLLLILRPVRFFFFYFPRTFPFGKLAEFPGGVAAQHSSPGQVVAPRAKLRDREERSRRSLEGRR